MFFLLSLQQNWRTREQENLFCPEGDVGGGGGPNMCTHVSKCKNDKIKTERELSKCSLTKKNKKENG
jgi:hypothetical protein